MSGQRSLIGADSVFPDPESLEPARQRALVDWWTRTIGLVVTVLVLYLNIVIGGVAAGLALQTPWLPAVATVAGVVGFFPFLVLLWLAMRAWAPGSHSRAAVCRVLGLPPPRRLLPYGLLLVTGLLFAVGVGVLQHPIFLDAGVILVLLFGVSVGPFARWRDPSVPRWFAWGLSGYFSVLSILFLGIRSVVSLGEWLGVAALFAMLVPILPQLLLRGTILRRLRAGEEGWAKTMMPLLSFLDRIEVELDLGMNAEAYARLTRLVRAPLATRVTERVMVLLIRALSQRKDPRVVPVVCEIAPHFPMSGPLHLAVARHHPDRDQALAILEFAEATAVRARLDPAPYITLREALNAS